VKKEAIANSSKLSVTFELPGLQAETVAVVGDFNNWDATNGTMKRRKDGVWTKAIRLAPGTYRYRYVADGNRWHNDPAADSYEASGMGEDNSILVLD
jgi:1,4-alpha-glucan branching enzyme